MLHLLLLLLHLLLLLLHLLLHLRLHLLLARTLSWLSRRRQISSFASHARLIVASATSHVDADWSIEPVEPTASAAEKPVAAHHASAERGGRVREITFFECYYHHCYCYWHSCGCCYRCCD